MATERRCLQRILLTADAVGGVWQYSVDLIRSLSSAGIEVLLATMGPPPTEQQKQQVRCFPGVQLVDGGFALEWMQEPWNEVDRAREWLADLEREFRPDIVHLNGYTLASGEWNAPVVSVAHSCVYSWWNAVHGSEPGPEWGEYRTRVARGLDSAAAVACPSGFMAQAVISHYGVNPGKVHVVHNYTHEQSPAVTAKEPFVLAAGRTWDKAKNFALLDEIASRVEWPLRIAGSDLPGLAEAAESRLAHRLGHLSHFELLEQMSRASIFVHPAFYEPFGLVVLEAAKARCCLILADIPSLRELWEGAAIFVNPRGEASWANELKRLINRPCEREHLADQAFLRADRYDSVSSTAKYIALYESMMNRQSAKGGVAA